MKINGALQHDYKDSPREKIEWKMVAISLAIILVIVVLSAWKQGVAR